MSTGENTVDRDDVVMTSRGAEIDLDEVGMIDGRRCLVWGDRNAPTSLAHVGLMNHHGHVISPRNQPISVARVRDAQDSALPSAAVRLIS